MGPIRKLGVAVVMAGVMAGGLGSATLEAKKKGDGGGGVEAICAYLQTIIEYPYVDSTIKAYAVSLATLYGCGQ